MEDHTITSTTRDSNTTTATPTSSSVERNEPSGSVFSITAPNTIQSMDPNQVTRTSDHSKQYHETPQPVQNMERSTSVHDHVPYESMATTENIMSNTISKNDGHCSSIQVKSGNPSAHLDFQTIQPETTMLQRMATHTHESSSPKPSSFFGDGMVSSSSCMKPLRTYSEDDQVEATPQQLRPLHVGTSHAQSSPPFVPVMNPNNTNNNSVRNFPSGKNEAEEHQTTTTANNCNNQKKMMEQKNSCNYTAAAARTDLESSSNITIPTTITTENSHPTISTTTTTDYYQQAPLPSLFSSSSSSGFLSQQAPQFRPLVSATSMTCLPPPSLLLLQEHEQQQQQGRMISSIPPWMHQPQSSQTESSGSTTTTTTTESIQIGDDNSHVHRRMHASSGGAGVVHGGTMPIPVSNVHLTYPTLHPPSSSSAATPPPQQQNTNADGSVHSTTKFNNKMMTNREGGNTNHTSNTISNSTSSSSRNQNVSKQKSATTMKQDGKKAMNNHNMGDGTLSESKTCVICGKADTGNKYISYTINESNIAQYRGCFAHVPNINIGDGVCKNCYAKKYKFVTGLSINKVKRKPGSTPQTTQPQAQPSLPSSASQQSHTPSSNSSKPPYLTSNVATNVVPPTSHSPPPLKKNSTAPPLLPTATKVGNYQKHHSLYTQPPVSSAYHHHHAGIAGYISPSVGENPMSGYPYCEGEVYSSGNSSENAHHHHEGYYQQQQQPGEMYTHQQYSSQYLPAQHRLSSHETRSSPTHSREYLYHPYSRPTSSQRSNYDYHSSVAHQQPYAPSPSSYHHADAYRAPPVMTQRGSRAVSPIVRASNGPYYSTPEHSVQLIERTSPYMNSNSPPYHTSPSNELAYSGSSGDASFPAIMTASDSSNRRESKHSLPSHRYHPYASSSNPYSRSSESQNDGVNNPVMNSSVPPSEISPPALSRNLPYGVVATGVAVSSQETRRRETRISQYDPLKDTTNAPNNLPEGVQSKQDHRITENVSANDASRSKLPSVKDLLNFPSETDSNTGDPSGMKEAKNQNEKQQFSFFSELIDDTSKKKLPMIDEKNQMDKLNLKDISQQRMVDIILSFVNEKVSSEAISTRMSIPRRVTLSDLRENINERARKCYMMDGCLTHTPNVGNILWKRDERNFIEIDDNFCLSNRFENNDMLRVVLQLTE
ncbi:hypothetical protein C9374_010761 [Naegleria lovaniensis]|uniref:Uncharacterized protein n=1 Tax=Naegleria lovaniensis TaxID=51637 RepID=A0AA88GB71_NAELO|nr:uncharacterized protein C9374_010761 [Naegleria lovaniensis]KAG2374477.1 hypothetical protein C9374_010761 [Naegleria lovaniensis]